MIFVMNLQVIAVAIAGLYINVSGRDQQSVQGVQGAFFILSAEVIFGTSYGVAHTYSTHLPILRRETGENVYKLSAYYVSKIICRIPGHIIDAFSFLGIIYMFAGFSNGWWLYIKFGLILTATGFTASAYGCMISGFFESSRMTAEVAPPLDLLFLILGGFYINLSAFSKLKFTSLFFFANEALSVTYWHNVPVLGATILQLLISRLIHTERTGISFQVVRSSITVLVFKTEPKCCKAIRIGPLIQMFGLIILACLCCRPLCISLGIWVCED